MIKQRAMYRRCPSFSVPDCAVLGVCAMLHLSAIPAAGEVFISQYYEGASNDKWVELFNTGTNTINLSTGGFRLGLWSNANREGWKTNQSPSASVALTGSLAPGVCYLIKHGSAALPSYATADLTSSSVCNFNGDDSLVLYRGASFSITGVVDSIGLTGTQLSDVSISRLAGTTSGKTETNNYLPSEWDVSAIATVNNAATGTPERLGFFANLISSEVDLAVFKSIDNDQPRVGSNVIFTIVVTNGSDSVATGVQIADAVPAGLTFLSAAASTGTYDSGSGIWTVGSIFGHSAVSMVVTAIVNGGTFGQTITNTAALAIVNENDSNPANNMASATISIPAYIYVSTSGGHVAPFISWDTAATNIQDAIDAAAAGEIVLVTNGIYHTGGKVAPGFLLTNRVLIDKPILVRSVNGPGVTTIMGAWDPATTNGDAAVRCVRMNAGSKLAGFTLANGATRNSGDNQHEMSGGGLWASASGTFASNCVLVGNSAFTRGGGAYGGTLVHCILTSNLTASGGGAYQSSLSNSTLTGNSASGQGGGANQCVLNNCALVGNAAAAGGGAYLGTLRNCTLVGNSATAFGGGTWFGTLNNCTLTGNSAETEGGGAAFGTLNNCIVYFNTAKTGSNYSQMLSINYSCTTPDPGGTNNITDNPRLASASRLSPNSPCISAGSTSYVAGADFDSEPWLTPPSMGADEFYPGGLTGTLTVAITASSTLVVPGLPVQFSAIITGRPTGSAWTMGDGISITNQPYYTHSYSTTGAYAVVLRAWNESNLSGVSATVTVVVVAPRIYYVNAANAFPSAPFTNWATAATTIQEAIDVASPGETILVSNGMYQVGGRAVPGTLLTNRVVIDKPVTVRSVNGPAVTVIRGSGPLGDAATRCVWMSDGAILAGFTLTNGATRLTGVVAEEPQRRGGGVWAQSVAAIISNCIITGNAAYEGGGAHEGTLNNCKLIGNSANNSGGGAYFSSMNNCEVTGNSAHRGGGVWAGTFNAFNNCTIAENSATLLVGGVYNGTLNNCIVYFNNAPTNDNASSGTLNYSCIEPLPTNGTGNITGDPQFENQAAGDYRLRPSSPCIDRGINEAWMFDAFDLAGRRRLINAVVDMGAHELVFEANMKMLLAGSYDTNTHRMTRLLSLPNQSPYAADARQSTTIPSNATDWVNVELRRETNGAQVYTRSAWLGDDGTLFSDTGGDRVLLETGTGTYYIVMRHRNHIATMTANPLPFTNRLVSYDFTTSASQNYGGSNAVIEVEDGAWALPAGDADGDGEILPVDELIWRAQAGE